MIHDQHYTYFIIIFIFSLGWVLVEEKKDCSGSEINKGKLQWVGDCAAQCKGEASMFIFGTNDFGTARCYGDGCDCYCKTSATGEGTCTRVNHNGYRLYKYGATGSKGYYHELHKCYVSNILDFWMYCFYRVSIFFLLF